MTEYSIEIKRGYCPEFDDNAHPIIVKWLRARYANGETSQPTLGSVRCNDQFFCRFFKKHGYCPLLNSIAER